ncbi:MAG: hypothetical protein ACI9BG_000586 [Parasphingorhabdus sp.]|mgnify:CR=1 FL=1|jgi:hypothetical protein|tara:strand:- start:3151 stop:3291 length:141 start_codon:yes stop_codon:yes gene_type:complete
MIQAINAEHAQNRTEVGYIAHFDQGFIVKVRHKLRELGVLLFRNMV